ncbi:MAG: hypothetical protein IJW82_07470, partial [Clostridia bacterium]|nr:hypothetical protein [Clostridia bacterium]
MKKNKTFIIYTFILLLAISLCSFGIFSVPETSEPSSASTNYQGVLFSVEKIKRYAGKSTYGKDPNSENYFNTSLDPSVGSSKVVEDVIFPVTNQDQAIMLNNAEIEGNVIEALKISLLPDENYIVMLSPTIKLNGQQIDCSGDTINTGTIKYRDPSTTDDCYKFIFYIDLTNIYALPNKEPIVDTNGYYEISLQYHYRFNDSQTTAPSNEIKFGIYLLDEVDFINSNSEASSYEDTNPRDNVGSNNAILTDTSVMNLDKDYAFQGFYNNNGIVDEQNAQFTRSRVEPRLYNTERIDRYIVSNSTEEGKKNYYVNYKPGNTALNTENAELNFFNFNNESTVDYDGNFNKSNEELLFPMYTYDASKYNLSWNYTYKSQDKYTVTSTFSISNNGVGTVSFKKGDQFLFSVSAQNDNGMYIANVPFSEIGEYEFTIRYTVREYIVGATTATSALTNNYIVIESLSDKIKSIDSSGNVNYVNRQKEYLVGDVNLSIFGYELYYTNEDDVSVDETDQSTKYSLSRFKNLNAGYNYLTDYTFLNQDRIEQEKLGRVAVEGAENTEKVNAYNNIYTLKTDNGSYTTKGNLSADYPIDLGTYDFASTNQAPVEFKYLGTFACENEKTNYSYSYYIHYPYGKGSNNGVAISQVTNSTRFTSNGTYDVIVFYNYSKYFYYDYSDDGNGGKDYNYNIQSAANFVHVQIFTFEIANTPPKITIQDEKGTVLHNGDYTNKTVNITIEKSNSPFNVQPVLSCNFTDYDTNNTSSLKLQEIGEGVYKADSTGNYKITVRYGQGRKSIQNAEFNIDKTPIANPTLFNANETSLSGNSTNKNFYLSYLDKKSGAPISVTYLYMPIDKLPSLAVSDIFAVENDESVIKNGYWIKQVFVDSSTYTKNSVINIPGFYFFTLKDKAGNVGYKYVLYDTTAPLILQKESKQVGNEWVYTDWYLSNYMNNIVTTDTIVHWGATKAIMTNDTTVKSYLELILMQLDNYGKVLTAYANTLSNSNQKALYTNQTDINNFRSTFCYYVPI